MGNIQLNFIDYSFDSCVAQLNSIVSQLAGWNSSYLFGNGQVIIDTFAATMNLVQYSIERRAQEGYLDSAMLRSSAVNLVSLLGYQVQRPVSATGNLSVTFPANTHLAYAISIPKNTKFISNSGFIYSATQDTVLPLGNPSNPTTVSIPVIEGTAGSTTVTGTGLISQSVDIPFTNIENNTLVVKVDGTQWTQVTTFFNSLGGDTVYTVEQNSDNTITLHFGNNLQGLAPLSGSAIVITYVESDGIAGNVLQSGSIITIKDKIYDTNGGLVSDATVTNAANLLGGADEESLEHIRYYAPKIFATGQRAVTKADFAALVGGISGIADSYVWGEYENSAAPDYNQFNNVNITAIKQDWTNLTPTDQENVVSVLQPSSMLTVNYTFVTTNILYTVVGVDLFCFPGTDLVATMSAVTSAINALFVLGDTAKLGQAVTISSLNSAISAIAGISYFHVNMSVQVPLVKLGAVSHPGVGVVAEWVPNTDGIIPQLPVAPGTVQILIGGVLVGKDDGFNNIKPLVGVSSALVGGGIDYSSTGAAYITVGTTNPLTAYIQYAMPSGDIVPSRNNICRLASVNFGTVAFVS